LNLALIVENLSADETRTIVAKWPRTANSKARLVSLTDEYRVPSEVLGEEFEFFLEADSRSTTYSASLSAACRPPSRFRPSCTTLRMTPIRAGCLPSVSQFWALPTVGLASAISGPSSTAALGYAPKMTGIKALDRFVAARLGGDESRLLELFATREVFDALRAEGQPSDWYHFEPKTLDGQYLVETPGGFEVYEQDRGSRTKVRRFDTLTDAARAFFE
jgi:hypothetical protein